MQRRLERAELCFGPVQRCQAVRTALDDHPELQQLRQAETLDTGERVHRVAQRSRRERKHKRAVGVAGPRLNEALALQDPQRLPNRRAAHLELPHQLALGGQAVVRGDLSEQDRLLDLIDDALIGVGRTHWTENNPWRAVALRRLLGRRQFAPSAAHRF